jgi:hypothetical protein
MINNYLLEPCRWYFNWNKWLRKIVHLVGLSHIYIYIYITIHGSENVKFILRNPNFCSVSDCTPRRFPCEVWVPLSFLTNIGMLRQMAIRIPNMKPCDRRSSVGSQRAMRANKPAEGIRGLIVVLLHCFAKRLKLLKNLLTSGITWYIFPLKTHFEIRCTRASGSLLVQGTYRLLVLVIVILLLILGKCLSTVLRFLAVFLLGRSLVLSVWWALWFQGSTCSRYWDVQEDDFQWSGHTVTSFILVSIFPELLQFCWG